MSEEKQKRGFATLSPEKRREIAQKGGRAAHAQGTAHNFTSEEGKAAGSIGGQTIARTPGHMAEIGRKGGQAVSRDREHMAKMGRKGGAAVSADREHMVNMGRKGGAAAKAARAAKSEEEGSPES